MFNLKLNVGGVGAFPSSNLTVIEYKPTSEN